MNRPNTATKIRDTMITRPAAADLLAVMVCHASRRRLSREGVFDLITAAPYLYFIRGSRSAYMMSTIRFTATKMNATNRTAPEITG